MIQMIQNDTENTEKTEKIEGKMVMRLIKKSANQRIILQLLCDKMSKVLQNCNLLTQYGG